MYEKELRLAVVCSGGVSLAVYMHGLVKELLKMVRASKLYHTVPDLDEKQHRNYENVPIPPGQAFDTEEIYFDLLQQVGQHVDLRVVIDVIAGASAGGINGVMLARALAHDLPFDALREMWLDGADIKALVAESQQDRWSERLFRPLVRLVAKGRLGGLADDEESASKLVSMLQITRLQTPFDGERLLERLLNALESMGEPARRGASLMPLGHELELFVTLTDFYGYAHRIPLYDPPVIEEREHRHKLNFRYRRWPNGDEDTDFGFLSLPALAFASRASASFPGLFPAARLGEVDNVLRRRNRVWDAKDQFLRENFKPYHRVGANPLATAFIDGAVLNNKPFEAAIDALIKRPAYRKVDRRLIYINPNPGGRPPPPDADERPGVLRTLKASLSDIPRNEPIADDLDRIRDLNRSAAQTRAIIEASRADIEVQVQAITRGKLERRHISEAQIARWRDLANGASAQAAGISYKGYIRLKLDSALGAIATVLCELMDVQQDAPEAAFLRRAIRAWADITGAFPTDFAPPEGVPKGPTPAWLQLLRGFDIDFRERRIRFVIQSLNQLYTQLDQPEFADLSAYRLDYLKRSLYEVLEDLRTREGTAVISHEAAGRVRRLLGPVLNDDSLDPATGHLFATENCDAISDVINSLLRDLALERMNYRADDVFATMESSGPGGVVRSRLLTDYLGFPFWDILTFSAGSWRNQGEFDEIRVARISPQDCTALSTRGTDLLLGARMGNFGAFFKRAHRENDYLWGRLHGADRLIDVICDAAHLEGADTNIDVKSLKKKAFERILATEAQHLPNSEALLLRIKSLVEKL